MTIPYKASEMLIYLSDDIIVEESVVKNCTYTVVCICTNTGTHSLLISYLPIGRDVRIMYYKYMYFA